MLTDDDCGCAGNSENAHLVDANKENMNHENTHHSQKPVRLLNSAPLRLVDAQKMVFAPSPKSKVQAAAVVPNDSLTTLQLVKIVEEKMMALKLQVEQV